ncbi:hypothetical protein [Deinococcus kurensis]|uniref:hypothetical protein n=1 Tax=Deinococcus kurensis TaxID=2662757 RepID=UPI0012D30574|nr:hypothetical protein [Deinococcus kurensis]
MRYQVKAYLFSTFGLYSAALVDDAGQAFLAGVGADEWSLTPAVSLTSAVTKYDMDPVQGVVTVDEPTREAVLAALEAAAREQR